MALVAERWLVKKVVSDLFVLDVDLPCAACLIETTVVSRFVCLRSWWFHGQRWENYHIVGGGTVGLLLQAQLNLVRLGGCRAHSALEKAEKSGAGLMY